MQFNDIIRSWKRIPYHLNFYAKNADIEKCDRENDNILEEINKYIKKSEFHEKIHCFVFRLFKTPSMIVYSTKYAPSVITMWASCRPLVSTNLLNSFLLHILHFLWDFTDDFFDTIFHPKQDVIHRRSFVELFRFYFRGFSYILKYNGGINYLSFKDIKNISDGLFLDEIDQMNKGNYSHFSKNDIY